MVLEGRNDIHLNVWLKNNQNEISKILSRADYLKIKYEPIKFGKNKLKEKSISFIENKDRSRYEQYLMTFSNEALTNDGEIKKDWFEKIFDGVLKKLISGDSIGFSRDMDKFLQKHQGDHPVLKEITSDLLYFAETNYFDNREIALAIIASVEDFLRKKEVGISEIEGIKRDLDIL